MVTKIALLLQSIFLYISLQATLFRYYKIENEIYRTA